MIQVVDPGSGSLFLPTWTHTDLGLQDPDPVAEKLEKRTLFTLIMTLKFSKMMEMWTRSSRVVTASDCQCRSRNSPGFGGPSILRHIVSVPTFLCLKIMIKQ
jgi:hypothetical protein